jgi:hypothetical protein
VDDTAATFTDRDGMHEWLNSELVEERSTETGWPTERSRQAWLQFYEGERKASRRVWNRETQAIQVEWTGIVPPPGTSVRVEGSVGTFGSVMTPDLQPLGWLRTGMRRASREVVSARVDAHGGLELEFFGPLGAL